jgi:hypothetical protein
VQLQKQSIRAISSGSSLIISTLNEPKNGEYSIVVFSGNNWVELVRQPSAWLEDTFNFRRPGGYSILGRRAFEIQNRKDIEVVPPLPPLIFKGAPISMNIDTVGTSEFPEIRLATGLLHYLWRQPIRAGPITVSYDEFLQYPFEEKLKLIRDGKFAVMCQGFRDLYLHASFVIPGLRVRAIEAMNYMPQFPDLITYSHSTVEIWIEKLRKWVLFDPWLGIWVSSSGSPVGALELHENRSKAQSYSVVPLMNSISRVYLNKIGAAIYDQFSPAQVKIAEFSCGNLACAPGYIEYFRHYRIRESVITNQ